MGNKVTLRIGKRITAWLAAAAIMFAVLVPALPVKAQSNEEYAFFYLTDTLGYNVAAACGIMANISHESHFYPGAGSWSGSYGLCQWGGGRIYAMEYYCYDHGFDPDSISGQLSFMSHELKNQYPGTYNYLMNVENSGDGAYNAAYRFCCDYERPANSSGKGAGRGNLASGTYWRRYSIYAYDQWIETDKGLVYHYTDGSVHHGWLELDADKYYLDQDGILKTGLFSADGSSYFSDEDGALQYGWQNIGDNTYYFDEETGQMQVGWIEVDGKMMFFDSNGKMTGVNSFNDKIDISDADIANIITEKEGENETAVNAPSADPMPLPDKVTDVTQAIQDAASGSQNSAAAVATPGKETEIDPDNYASSEAVSGNKIDTTKLEVGTEENSVTMEESVEEPVEESQDGSTETAAAVIQFENAAE